VDWSQLNQTLPAHDVALKIAPAFLLLAWSLPLPGLENFVMILVSCQAQTEIEARSRQDSHQCWNGRLPTPRFIGGHHRLGHAESIGQLSLRESRLQSGRENEAASNGRALGELRGHLFSIVDRL
jgi:hypothetical protein